MVASKSLSVPEASAKSLAAMTRIGRTRSPAEACGLLLMTPDVTNQRVIELANRSLQCHTSYAFTADDVKITLDRHPMAGVEVAVWHTHPGGSVGPSTEDIQNKLRDVPYLVVTLFDDGTTTSQWF